MKQKIKVKLKDLLSSDSHCGKRKKNKEKLVKNKVITEIPLKQKKAQPKKEKKKDKEKC